MPLYYTHCDFQYSRFAVKAVHSAVFTLSLAHYFDDSLSLLFCGFYDLHHLRLGHSSYLGLANEYDPSKLS